MRGDIIYIDYELNSWKYPNDEKMKSYFKYTDPVLTGMSERDIIYKTGYVCKGGGSAFGGDWKPKKESDKHFLSKPNSIQHTHKEGKNGGYDILVKYDKDGKSVAERHLTDHNRPDKHSNPHDHKINWDKGFPDPSSPINYPGGNAPEFKKYNMEVKIMDIIPYNPEENKFETIGEFKFYLSRGWNVGFEWHGVEYGIEGHNNSFDIWIYDKGDIANGLTLEQTLDYEFDGVKLRELILTAEIIERMCT